MESPKVLAGGLVIIKCSSGGGSFGGLGFCGCNRGGGAILPLPVLSFGRSSGNPGAITGSDSCDINGTRGAADLGGGRTFMGIGGLFG
mmetsp:Transcript_13919/g.35988  ORF Transcript_13919/g.35988 Transcript_13919/m.35988 type:complete len:88 (+) Transcript_13919:1-264(+)